MTFSEAWEYGKTLDGWFGDDEAELLWNAAAICSHPRRPGPFLEIGSYHGRSASLLLRHRTTILIDSSFLWMNPARELGSWDGTAGMGYKYEDCRTDLEAQAILCKNLEGLPFVLIPVPSQRVMIGNPQLSLIHIDGDHTKGGIDKDCGKYLPLLANDGMVAFHDYDRQGFPDVVEAVDQYTEGWYEFGHASSLIVKVKP